MNLPEAGLPWNRGWHTCKWNFLCCGHGHVTGNGELVWQPGGPGQLHCAKHAAEATDDYALDDEAFEFYVAWLEDQTEIAEAEKEETVRAYSTNGNPIT